MNVLVVGGGAREHALCWKLRQSPLLKALYAAPGNAGTAALAQNLPHKETESEALIATAKRLQIDLAVIGPEVPLAAGLADALRAAGIAVYGPSRAAAEIEASKVWAKELMARYGIPTARAATFEDPEAARRYAASLPAPPVVKADGLAAGKGVVVAETLQEALEAIEAAMVRRVFGDAGRRIVLEERLTGRELSAHAFCDGIRAVPMEAACDYKRAFDGDRGPNTGGMGAYSPPAFMTPQLATEIQQRIVGPVIAALAAEGRPFRGTLFSGLMLTDAGPKVVEFNCRFGDPETEVILPRLQSDLLPILHAAATGSLEGLDIVWDPRPCVAVVLASGGYPGTYRTGLPIHGLHDLPPDVIVFHAGTRLESGQVMTAGGRVLTVAALGETIAAARARAYEGVRCLAFDGAQYRTDIALLAS